MARIDRLLAQCLDAIQRGDSVQECLARHPERREELEPLLRAAQRVRSAPTIVPSEAFRQGARERMLNSIRAQARGKEPERLPERGGLLDRLRLDRGLPLAFRRLAVPALATIIVLAMLGMMGIGVVYASSESLPGDSLYPVKLAGERVRLALSPSPAAETRLRLQLAGERLEEATQLTDLGVEDDVESLMTRYTDEVEAARSILQSQHDGGRDVTLLSRQLQENAAQQQLVLAEIREHVSEGTQPAVERALAASRAAAKEALTTATPAPAATPRPTRTPQLPPTATPTATRRPSEELAPSETPEPRDPTKTPLSPGQASTAQPPSWTTTPPSIAKTEQPSVVTNTPQPPGETNTPQPPEDIRTTRPPGRTNTPQPPGKTKTPEPSGKTNTPQPADDTNVTLPPGATNTPQPPGDTNTTRPPGQTKTPQPPGQTKTPQPPGRTDTPQPPGQSIRPSSG